MQVNAFGTELHTLRRGAFVTGGTYNGIHRGSKTVFLLLDVTVNLEKILSLILVCR